MTADFAQILIRAKDDTKGAFDSASRNIRGLESAASKLGGVLSTIGIGAGLSAAGLAAFVKSGIDAQDEISKLSQKTGIAVETLAGLQHAADLSGVGVDQLAKGVRTFSVLVDEAANGQKSYQDKLVSLGLNYKDLKNLAPEKQFYALADAVSKLGEQDRAVSVSGASGDRMSILVPLLSSGASGVRELVSEGQRLNPVTAESARRAEEFNDNLDRLKKEAGLAGIELTTNLIPSLSDTSKAMVDLARDGHGVLAMWRGFAGLGKIPWDLLIGDIEPARTAQERIKELREELGALERKSKSGDGKLLQLIFGTPQEIQQQMTVIRNQIAALEKFGDKIYTPKQPTNGGGTDTTAAQRDCILSGGVWDGKKCRPKQTQQAKVQGPIDVFANRSFITSDKSTANFIRNQYDAVNELQGLMAGDASKAAESFNSRLSSLLSDTNTAKAEALGKDFDILSTALKDGRISNEQYAEAMGVLFEKMNNGQEKVRTLTDDLGDAFKDTFEHAGYYVRDLSGLLDDLKYKVASIFANRAGQYAANWIADAFFKPSADGNVFTGAPALSAYSGSIVSRPTFFPFAKGIGLMGEAGAEAILPLKRGRDGKLGVSMDGGGQSGLVVQVYNTIDARGADAGVETRIRRAVADAVDQSVAKVQSLNQRGHLRLT